MQPAVGCCLISVRSQQQQQQQLVQQGGSCPGASLIILRHLPHLLQSSRHFGADTGSRQSMPTPHSGQETTPCRSRTHTHTHTHIVIHTHTVSHTLLNTHTHTRCGKHTRCHTHPLWHTHTHCHTHHTRRCTLQPGGTCTGSLGLSSAMQCSPRSIRGVHQLKDQPAGAICVLHDTCRENLSPPAASRTKPILKNTHWAAAGMN
jgi:hypothetical protein